MAPDRKETHAKKNVTMSDVAKMSKVSQMTVSRVLKGNPNVKKETRDKVQKIINKLNYTSIPRVSHSLSKQSHLIGLIVPDIQNQFFSELARGIEDKASEAGYNVIFCSTDNKPERLETSIHQLKSIGVDGYLIASARMEEPVVNKLISEKAPLVLVNRRIREDITNYVVIDNNEGAYQLTRHLIELGYTKIAHITINLNWSTGLGRLKGYERALKDYGIEPRKEYIVHSQVTKKSSSDAAKQLLALDDPPEAIFGGSDSIALGVFNVLKEIGLKVPDDIAIVGFDNTEFAANKWIDLTTVSQKKYEMGNLAVEILINYIRREEKNYIHKVILDPELIVRRSCGCQL